MINWKHRQIFKMSTLSEIVDTSTSGNIDEEDLEESMFQLSSKENWNRSVYFVPSKIFRIYGILRHYLNK